MKRNWLILIAVLLAIVLVGLVIKSKFFGKPSPAAISISSTPRATVFIDEAKVGNTPYLNDKITVGEHTVKLVPESTTDGLSNWEGKVNLTSNIMTVVNRTLAASESVSSGEIIWLEKINSKDKSSLAVVSLPDKAVIRIEGEPKGFAPFVQDNLEPGSYQLIVSSPGYEERSVSAKTIAGYKLIVNVQLAKKVEGIQEATVSGEQTEMVTPTAKVTPKLTPSLKPYVKIKETPTGWLRVRETPEGKEVGRVNPGEEYSVLDEQKYGGTTWYKIEYETEKQGWVSGAYVDLVK